MTSAKADCIMRFICLMQERLLPKNGKPSFDILSEKRRLYYEIVTNNSKNISRLSDA